MGQWVLITWSDGNYSVRPLKDGFEADDWKRNGGLVTLFSPAEWRAWQAHCDAAAVWDGIFRRLDDAAYETRIAANKQGRV